MHIRTDLLPKPPYRDVVVLVDVLRSGTTAPILFDNGLKKLHLARKIKAAHRLAAESGAVLVGERRGILPEGFNYSNSPAMLHNVPMPAEAVLVSENAPKTLALLESAEHLLLASLYNADAAAQRALELAKERIFLVACGLWEQEDLDDAIALAYLAAKLKQLKPEIHLEGASWFCINLLKAFPDPLEALWRSSAGHFLRKLNQEDDLAIASLVSQSAHVPERMGSQEQDGTVIYTFRSQIS